MYSGEAITALDDKNRITVPRKYRDVMDGLGHSQFFMTRGFDKSIFLFPRQQWDIIRGQAARYSSMDAHAIDFRRMFFGSVEEVQLDKQGRVPVPPHLREHAEIDKDIVFVGVDDHLELWSRENWRAFQERQENAFKQTAAALFTPQPMEAAAARG